jgi:hypothetical protein
MTEDTKLEIGYGRRTFPDDVRAVWGARLIWPDDLVYNRQDLAAHNDDAKQALVTWLNGADDTGRNGAIAKMIAKLRDANWRADNNVWPDMKFETEVIIYEDDEGKIVGSAQASHGNMYVCGWLKEHVG